MVTKLVKPLVVAAKDGPAVLVTLPAESTVEFELVAEDYLADDHLTEVLYDGESYMARSQELLEAVQTGEVGEAFKGVRKTLPKI